MSCYAMQYYTCPYCHQNIKWSAVACHWGKSCHVVPYYTCPYCHQNITQSAVACHWGKSCHVMSCHAILYMSLLPSEHQMVCCRLSLGESKSCDNRPHHTLPYMSLPSACHIVCCHLSLGEACHAMSFHTVPYNTAISMPHGLLSILSGAKKPHHTPHQLSHHTILQHTAPYTPFYIIPHHTTSCHAI